MYKLYLCRPGAFALFEWHPYIVGHPVVREQDALKDVFCGVLALSDEQSFDTFQEHTVSEQQHDGYCGYFGLPELINHDPVVLVVCFEYLLLDVGWVHVADGFVLTDDLAHRDERVGCSEQCAHLALVYAGYVGVFCAG